jgi:hypothetical protein
MEMMKTPLAVIVLLILYSSVVEATEEIGLEILDTCLSEQKAMQGDPVSSVRYGLCLGYLKGVADSLNGHGVCLPEYMNTVQLTQALKLVFLDYVKGHQEQLKLPAKLTVVAAFQQAFPCRHQN